MILLTEEQVTKPAQALIDFLRTYEETSELSMGEWMVILSSAIFMLGQSAGVEVQE